MALQSSGPISFRDLNIELGNSPTSQLDIRTAANEFGLSTPDAMNEFYGLAVTPPTTTYYLLNRCTSGPSEYTSINPAAGIGQRYSLFAGGAPIFYTYGGTFLDSPSPPLGFNGSIQIVFGQTGCP